MVTIPCYDAPIKTFPFAAFSLDLRQPPCCGTSRVESTYLEKPRVVRLNGLFDEYDDLERKLDSLSSTLLAVSEAQSQHSPFTEENQ